MDSSDCKLYNVHCFDSRRHLEHYYSDNPELSCGEDTLVFPIENLKKTFTDGHITGDILIDCSLSSFIHHLYAACEFFQCTLVLKVSDGCIMEMKRWLDTRTGAFDWAHATKHHVGKEGCSDQLEVKEGKVRSAVQHVMKCDLEKHNITDPMVLPPADCVISTWLLETICKDQDDYIRYLRKFKSLLKPGGYLILFGILNITYYTVGKHKFHAFKCDDDFVRKALVCEGFVIDNFNLRKTTFVSDLTDYKGVFFFVAHKEK